MMAYSQSVVVGGGRRAAMALALCEPEATCAVTMVGKEALAPSEAPNLSKELVSGKADPSAHTAPFVPPGDRVVLHIDDRLGGIAWLDTPKDFLVARGARTASRSVDAKRAVDPAVDLVNSFRTHTISRVAS